MKVKGTEMGKYAVIALCENGNVLISRKGGPKGYDTFDEAKYVAKLHSEMGVPVCIAPMESLVGKDGTISLTPDVSIVGGIVEF